MLSPPHATSPLCAIGLDDCFVLLALTYITLQHPAEVRTTAPAAADPAATAVPAPDPRVGRTERRVGW